MVYNETSGKEQLAKDIEVGRLLFTGQCDFIAAANNMKALPPVTLPEICFAGRSNVGKSSLINALTGRRMLARTSQTPGRTRQLIFFNLASRLQLVDLPGYGYASAPKTDIKAWTNLTHRYLARRPSLQRVFLLIDSRRGIGPADRDIMNLLDETADLIAERYRVLADTSKLPGTHLETPFGTIDDTMRSSIRSILDDVKELGRLPVVTFSAGGIATPADASHMMRMGMDGIFVGSGIFKSDDPPNMADAIVLATAHYDDASKVAEAQAMIEGNPMKGDELETLEIRLDQRGW